MCPGSEKELCANQWISKSLPKTSRKRMKKSALLSEETKKKVENFFYYYKFHVLLGAFVLFFLIIFIRDMVTKIEYDYSIAFLGNYSLTEEDSQAFQTWFQEHGEDLNGDGEVHVQLSDYSCPDEEDDGFDPQVFAAMQTRFIVDVQEGTSMIFFLNQEKYEDYKDEGVFPANAEDYTSIQDCQGYKEAGSPQSAGEYMVALRIIDESSGLSEDEEIQDYYTANEKLLREFIGE